MTNNNTVSQIAQAVVNLDEEKTLALVKHSIDLKINAMDVLEKGLSKGIKEVGEKFAEGSLFLTDLMLSANIMNQSVELLKPSLKGLTKQSFLGKFVIGTVEGDIHDVGKNIVIVMLQAAGFEVFDLGKDVPNSKFIEKVKEVNPDIVGASALLTTTMQQQGELIKELNKQKLRTKVKIMIGGAPVTPAWANKIGADAYGIDAFDTVTKAKELLRKK